MTHGKRIPRTQIAAEISGVSWTSTVAIGASAASRPRASASRIDGDQRAMTKDSSEASKRIGSRPPVRCATTTGTSTASATAASGARGTHVHTAKATTEIAAMAALTAEDGSATAATIRTTSAKGGTRRRTSSPSDHA